MGNLIISQGIPKHSRIGNSLVLLNNLHLWSETTGHCFDFPFPALKFPCYVGLEPHDISTAGRATYASLLPHVVRYEQALWEAENGVKPYQYPDKEMIVVNSLTMRCPVVFNYLDCVSHLEKVEALLAANPKVVLHEPFPFNEWRVREDDHSNDFHRSLLPSDLIYNKAVECLKVCGLSVHSFIAVHARLSDYKEFSKGQYYYSKDFYIELASNLSREFGRNVALFSDEKFNEYSFDWLTCVDYPDDELCFSMLQLASVIVGPPSTYSALAAKIGRKVSGSHLPSHVQITNPDVDAITSQIRDLL